MAGFGPDFGSQFGKFGPFGTREIYRHYAPIFTRFAHVAGFRLFGHLGQPQVGPSADPILAIWTPFGPQTPFWGPQTPFLGFWPLRTPFLTQIWGPFGQF